MTEPTLTASYRVIERVRQKISTQWVQASDTRISKLLGISRTSVSAYKHGRDVMSIDTLARAQEILELPGPELAALSIELSKEGTKNPGALKVLEAMLEAVRGHAASILLGAVGLITALQVFDLSSHSEALAGFGLIDFVFIMRITSAIQGDRHFYRSIRSKSPPISCISPYGYHKLGYWSRLTIGSS